MKYFGLFLLPLFLSFTDCNSPREPAQPISSLAASARMMPEQASVSSLLLEWEQQIRAFASGNASLY